MSVTTRTRYSLRAMIDIARHQGDGPVRSADIAERQQLSAGYLERILLMLVEAGLAESRKGPGGGYLLARPPEKVSLAEVMAASGEELLAVPCVCETCNEECDMFDECPAREVWSGLRDVAGTYLEKHSLSEFLEVERRAGDNKKNGLRPLRSTAG